MRRDPIRERLILEENRRMILLRRMMDRTLDRLRAPEVQWEEARRIIGQARELALRLFPGKESVFDLVYKPRFYKVLDEKWRLM
jgi:hypothetical protein